MIPYARLHRIESVTFSNCRRAQSQVVLAFHTAVSHARRPGAASPKAGRIVFLPVAPVWRRGNAPALPVSEAVSLPQCAFLSTADATRAKPSASGISWGRGFGDRGYAWRSYAFWSRNVGVGYVIDWPAAASLGRHGGPLCAFDLFGLAGNSDVGAALLAA